MEITVKIKELPVPKEPLLVEIEGLYTGPHIGDVLVDENGLRWIARDKVRRFEVDSDKLQPGIFGNYRYDALILEHCMTLKDGYSIRYYMDYLIKSGFYLGEIISKAKKEVIEGEQAMNNIEITEEEKGQILDALSDRRYRWRTTIGISEETGVDLAKVLTFIDRDTEYIVESLARSTTGSRLYTTRENWLAQATLWERFRAAFINRLY